MHSDKTFTHLRYEARNGVAAGRMVAMGSDTLTTAMGRFARASDGRLFRDILNSEGIEGLKRARDLQYREPWLAPLLERRNKEQKPGDAK